MIDATQAAWGSKTPQRIENQSIASTGWGDSNPVPTSSSNAVGGEGWGNNADN